MIEGKKNSASDICGTTYVLGIPEGGERERQKKYLFRCFIVTV